MKKIFILLSTLVTVSGFANTCQKSLAELRQYITFQRTPTPMRVIRPTGKMPEPLNTFMNKVSCMPAMMSHVPVINFGCLNDKAYVRDALRLFTRDINAELERLNSLVDLAQDTKIAALEMGDQLEAMILKDMGNNALTKQRKQFYLNQLMNYEQSKFMCSRVFGNQISNLIATGTLLGRFTPHLQGEEDVIAETLGFESVSEVVELKQYLTGYGKDLRDAPIEIEMANKELDEASARFGQIYNSYLK